jgi:hypothetical protein
MTTRTREMARTEETNRAVREVTDKIEKDLRAQYGDKFVDGLKRITKQRDDFKTELTNAIENGVSGPSMAMFLNGNAWLWTYLYEDVERDPEFKAKVECALGLCSQSVPEAWLRAVREAKERHPDVMELRRRFCW